MPSTSRKHVVYFDVLNIVACFGVVAMHVNGLTHSFLPSLRWVQAFSVDCLFYWAVPVFFMLSGATLLGYRSRCTTREFLKKRLFRTFVPFVCWSLFSYVWLRVTGQQEALGPRSILSGIMTNQFNSTYWFFAPLFSVYLSMPVLSLLADNKKVLEYGIVAGVVFNVCGPLVAELLGVTWNVSFSAAVVSGYLLYPLVGYWLANNDLPRWGRLLVYALGLLSVMYRFAGTVSASFQAGELVKVGWEYAPSFFEGPAVFVVVKSLMSSRVPSERVTRVLSKVSACSFGIYLIHTFVIWHIRDITGLAATDNLWRLAGPVLVYGICLAIVYFGRKAPGLRRVLP